MGGSMSSIVVSGDTSGAITIAAPAVSGTNTITLPASTGTAVVADGSGNITATGNVTGKAFIPSNSTVPTNGVFLPATNSVGFATNTTEAGRFNSSGQFLLSTTSGTMGTTGKLPVQRIASSTTSMLGFEAGSTSSYNVVLFNNPNGEVGQINTSASATLYGTVSDYRLKENVQPIQNALETVLKLNPVAYTWKIDNSAGQGFIAHELQALVPNCVNGEKDAVNDNGSIKPQSIDTSYLVATLTKAIQELNEKIAVLEAKVK